MKCFMNFCRLIKCAFKIRICATIYFNFHYLPFNVAVKMPVILHHKSKFIMGKGAKVIVNPATKGKINIGVQHASFSHKGTNTIIKNQGVIVFHGGNIKVRAGSIIKVSGLFELYGRTILGESSKVVCQHKIVISEDAWFAHECQIFDTNFHYLKELDSELIKPITNPIFIGRGCWIGNRCSIMSGTVLSDYTIVASNSLTNKDYTTIIESYSMIAGLPAKFIRKGIMRYSLVEGVIERELKRREFELNRKKNRGKFYGQEV